MKTREEGVRGKGGGDKVEREERGKEGMGGEREACGSNKFLNS